MNKLACCIVMCILLFQDQNTAAQNVFSSGNLVTDQVNLPTSLAACDVNSDGNIDILSTSSSDDKIAWYENLGGGIFGSQQIISANADGASDIMCVDLDGDSKEDVLYAARFGNRVSWQKSIGNGTFGPEQVITSQLLGPFAVHAADMDGDGDNDVLTTSLADERVSYFENLGQGLFAGGTSISITQSTPTDVTSADLDKDGDHDVIIASFDDDRISWFENFDGDSFGLPQVISQSADGAYRVLVKDIDDDGDEDIIAAASNDHAIFWYENDGNAGFNNVIQISNTAFDVRNIAIAHVNGDDYPDVISASFSSDAIEWYPNLNNGSFGAAELISGSQNGPHALVTGDLDDDGDADIVAGDWLDNTIQWYVSPRPNDCTAPDQLSVDILSSKGATLSWVDAGDPHLYRVVGGALGGAPVMIGTASKSLSINGLSPNTGYYWTVGSICGIDFLPIGKVDTFFTKPDCHVPVGIQTQNIGLDSAVFTWMNTDTNAIGYKVGIKELDAPLSALTVINVNSPVSQFNMQNLVPCKAYQWALVSACGYELSKISPVNTFLTLGCNSNKGMPDQHQEKECTIFPNPASDNVHIRYDDKPERISISSINGLLFIRLEGREIQEKETTIDVQPMSNGMYHLSMHFGENLLQHRLIIAR